MDEIKSNQMHKNENRQWVENKNNHYDKSKIHQFFKKIR